MLHLEMVHQLKLIIKTLQSYRQRFIVKHIDCNLVELIWTTKNWEISSVSVSVKKLNELRNFTNTNRRNCPKCSFFSSMNRQTRVKNKQESGIFYRVQWDKKSKYCCHPPFHPPIFCRHSLKFCHPPSQN